jgi:sortase A
MRRTIAAVGRTLVTVGLLILLFVGYQLWGTGYFTARAQADLRDDFEAAQEAFQATTTTTEPAPIVSPGPTTTTTTTPPVLPPLEEGQWLGIIEIPKIGVDKIFVEGTSRDDLKKGPGHYIGTPIPGQLGNAAIAGHRTTYGAPFNRLDELAPGDEIITTTLVGRYTYKVRETLIVGPDDTYVVDNTPDAQLTLTSCHPKYSASQRIVVKADIVVEQSSSPPIDYAALVEAGKAPPPPEPQPAALAEGLEGEQKALGPTVGWGAIAALVGLVWWWFFRRWHHPLTWLAGVVPFLVVLFGFYVFLERALPAGY